MYLKNVFEKSREYLSLISTFHCGYQITFDRIWNSHCRTYDTIFNVPRKSVLYQTPPVSLTVISL